MVDEDQRGGSSQQGGNVNANAEMMKALKKLQSDVAALKSENETLKKELTRSNL